MLMSGGRVLKATALVLILAVAQVYLGVSLARAASAKLFGAPAQGGAHQGRLTTRGNNPVSVNGTSAKSGETIFSGQTIQTPAGVGATVNIPGLGRVDIAPNTTLTFTFADGTISVSLASGCAILTTNKGVAGTVLAGGSTQQTDASNGGSLDVCSSQTPGAPPVVGQGAASAAGAGASSAAGAAGAAGGAAAGGSAASGGLFGLGTAGTFGFVGAAAAITTAAIITPCRRGANPSPGVPRGVNDECR
jgi:hypothetical protein